MKILSDLIELRRKIGGLKAEKKAGGPNFPVKSAKDLMVKLRDAADEIGMPVAGAVVGQDFYYYPIITGVDKYGNTQYTTVVHCVCRVRFESSDGSFREFTGSGHGADTQDKAGGKASTYAWKDAVTKALSLPDAEMVDTDDEAAPITTSKAPTYGEVLKAIKSAENLKQLEAVKLLAQRAKLSKSQTTKLQAQFLARREELDGSGQGQ